MSTDTSTDCSSASSMKREMEEMAQMLREIQGGARALAGASTEKTLLSRRLTKDQKQQKATSAWARSKSDRSKRNMVDKEVLPDDVIDADVARSEKVVRCRAAAYSFGIRHQEVVNMETCHKIYDVNIEYSSTRKRITCSKFSNAGRLSDMDNKKSSRQDGNKAVIMNKQPDSCYVGAIDDEDVASKRSKNGMHDFSRSPHRTTGAEHSSRGYSFPKSSREVAYKCSTDGASGDVEGAEKRLYPKAVSVIMRPPSVSRRVPNEECSVDQNTDAIASNSPDIVGHLDVLSTKMRTSVYRMHKDTVKVMNPGILSREKGTPGPGDYNPDPPSQSGAALYDTAPYWLILLIILKQISVLFNRF